MHCYIQFHPPYHPAWLWAVDIIHKGFSENNFLLPQRRFRSGQIFIETGVETNDHAKTLYGVTVKNFLVGIWLMEKSEYRLSSSFLVIILYTQSASPSTKGPNAEHYFPHYISQILMNKASSIEPSPWIKITTSDEISPNNFCKILSPYPRHPSSRAKIDLEYWTYHKCQQ